MAKSGVPKVRLRPRAPAGAATPQMPQDGTLTSPAAKRGCKALARPRPSEPEFWTVINEIPDPIPVALAELDAIESYFSAVLDDVFDPSRKSSR